MAEVQDQRMQVFTGDGTFLRKWGSQGTGDGQFRDPIGIAVDGSGRVYIADRTNHRVQVFSSDGTFPHISVAPHTPQQKKAQATSFVAWLLKSHPGLE